MAIQNRRGAYRDFDPTKMVAGEWAVVQTGEPNASRGRSVYMAFENGQVERMATYEDMEENIQSITSDIQTELREGVEDAIGDINTAISNANTAVSNMQTQVNTATGNVNTRMTAIETDYADLKADNASELSNMQDAVNIAIGNATNASNAARESAQEADEAAAECRQIVQEGMVASVFGRTGVVTAQLGDYSADLISRATGNVDTDLTQVENGNLLVADFTSKDEPNPSEYINMDIFSPSEEMVTYPFAETTKTENGITFTDNGDGTITVNGTSTAVTLFKIGEYPFVPDQPYYIDMECDATGKMIRVQYFDTINKQAYWTDYFQLPNTNLHTTNASANTANGYAPDGLVSVYLKITQGQTFDNEVVTPTVHPNATAVNLKWYFTKISELFRNVRYLKSASPTDAEKDAWDNKVDKTEPFYDLDTAPYELTTDTTVDATKTYYTYDSTTATYSVVANPVDADIATYYECTNDTDRELYAAITTLGWESEVIA